MYSFRSTQTNKSIMVDALFDAAGLDPRFRVSNQEGGASIPTVGSAGFLSSDFVQRNRPVLIASALVDWPPVSKWADDAYLRNAAPDVTVPARRVNAATRSAAGGSSYEIDHVPWPSLISSLSDATINRTSAAAAHYAAQVACAEGAFDICAHCVEPDPTPCWTARPEMLIVRSLV